MHLCLCFNILVFPALVNSFEPISTSIFLGISAIGGFQYFDQIKEQTYCRFKECCLADKIPFDIISLQDKLKTQLFGQHIVEEVNK